MSSTNKTANYSLSQWDAGDMLTHGDVNEDNRKIDAALKSAENGVAALGAKLTEDGYCRIQTGTYTGTGVNGEPNKNTLTFNFTPKIVVVMKADQGYHTFGKNFTVAWGRTTLPTIWMDYVSSTALNMSYSGNSMSWYGPDMYRQLNETGVVYAYYALT